MNVERSFVNYVIFRELCDRMRFEVDCAKSHHRVISEGLPVECGLSLDQRPSWNTLCFVPLRVYSLKYQLAMLKVFLF